MSDSPSRVQRRRQAAMDEIITVARNLLRLGEDVSLSAVAAQMGVTAPALYRYVPNLTGLIDVVVDAIMSDVSERMSKAADRQHDPASRVIAAATAFRQWALNNPHEFRLAFAPRNPLAPVPTLTDPSTAVERASAQFLGLFTALMNSFPAPPPDSAEVPPTYDEIFLRLSTRRGYREAPESPESVARSWQFDRAWVRFIGVLCCEVFGFVPPELVVSGDVFVRTCMEIGNELGLGDDLDRLLDIAVETADWTDSVNGAEPLHVTAARLSEKSLN